MMKKAKFLCLAAALLLTLGMLAGCESVWNALDALPDLTEDTSAALPESDAPVDTSTALPDENGSYTERDDVALYLWTYRCLPRNFLTKADARALGWEGGSLEPYAPGCSIGGDRFGNRERLLPEASGRTWYECDVNYAGGYRGAERVLYSSDGLIYYTDDHYESFTPLYEFED